MKQIQLQITALSPLAIGRKKPGSVSEAGDHIPGSVIRGAIASTLLSQAGSPETGDDFHSLFLDSDAAIFQNAYPGTDPSVTVLPATTVSSKANPGFRPKGNGVFDTLIDRLCAEKYNHPYDPSCPIDGERVEPYNGFYTQVQGNYTTHAVAKRLLTRVGINRRRATSEEQILYSIEVLNETQGDEASLYQGSIWVANDALAKQLTQYLNTYPFRLGGAISRGLGRVKIEATCLDGNSTVSQRIDAFNQALQKRWQTWGIFGQPQWEWQERTYFTLNLQAEAILTDNWRRTTVISPTLLEEFTQLQDPSLQLHTAYTSYDYRSGWNTAWGRMKDIELVTNRGSVYLFSTSQPQLWTEALEKLEIQGVGKRTTEGFGQVQVCHPFHLIFREEAV